MQATGLRERNKARRRAAIVAAALELFAERGYDETTIADIAEAAEIAPRTVLTYFPTKEDIAMAPVDDVTDRVAMLLRERTAEESPLDVFENWLRGELLSEEADPATHERMRRMIERNPKFIGLQMARVSEVVAEFTKAVADDIGVDVNDPEPGIAVAAAVGIMSYIKNLPIDSDRDGTARAAIAYLSGGLDRLRDASGTDRLSE